MPHLGLQLLEKVLNDNGLDVAFALAALYADHHEPLIVRHHIVGTMIRLCRVAHGLILVISVPPMSWCR